MERNTEQAKSNNELKSYSGHQIAVLGEVMAKVTANQQTKVLTSTVAGTSHNNLLRRDWLQVLKLDWAEIVAVNSVREDALTSLFQKYELVCKEELGHCKNIKPHIVQMYFNHMLNQNFANQDQFHIQLKKLSVRTWTNWKHWEFWKRYLIRIGLHLLFLL